MLLPLAANWVALIIAFAIALMAVGALVKRRGKRWQAIVALVVAAAIALVASNTPQALVLHDAPGGMVIEKLRVLGTPDGAGPDCRPKGTWVINRSSRPVRVEHVIYGQPLVNGPPEPPQVIAPGTACSTHDIDDIGPDHPPPAREKLTGEQATLHSGSREWLTW